MSKILSILFISSNLFITNSFAVDGAFLIEAIRCDAFEIDTGAGKELYSLNISIEESSTSNSQLAIASLSVKCGKHCKEHGYDTEAPPAIFTGTLKTNENTASFYSESKIAIINVKVQNPYTESTTKIEFRDENGSWVKLYEGKNNCRIIQYETYSPAPSKF